MNKTTLLDCNQILDIFSSSNIATAIYTTNDLIIEAVTDAMLNFWGKDRSITGLPLIVAVPELSGQGFIEQLQSALHTGIAVTGIGVPAETLIDHKLQVRYYDYEYKPLKNAGGEIYSLIHTATDVTHRILGNEAIEKEKKQRRMLENERVLNEELAVANEELSAINEELQQTQEKLHELNLELEDRVTERTCKLAESEANMRYMIDDAPVAIAVLKGTEFIIEQANQYMLHIWGKQDKIIGQSVFSALPEIQGQGFFELLQQVYAGGEAYTGREAPGIMEYDGEMRRIFTDFVFKPLKDDKGQTHSIMIVATEVTEQVQARQLVEAGKHRLEAMVNNTPVAMTILKGRDLIIETANQPMLDVWRRERKEVINRGLLDVFPELKDQPNPARMLGVFESGRRFALPETAVSLVMPDGSIKTHYANFSYDPLFDTEGKVESILITVIDITENVKNRKELEDSQADLQETTEELAASNEELTAINEEIQASNEELMATQDQLQDTVHQLKESEERFRFLLNAIPQQVWTATPDGALDYVNDVVCADFGYNTSQIVGHGWQKFIHQDDLPLALERWVAALQSGKEYVVEFRLLFGNGIYKWHLARAIPLVENGEITLWLGTNTDIDLQKNNEHKKDEFLSIASHELKTPLTSIKAFNQLMRRTKDAERITGFMDKSAEHIRRLEKLIGDLLDVTRLNAGKLDYNMKPFRFKQLLEDSVESVQHMSPTHRIILEQSVDTELTGDQFRLEQVMTNFLTNAIKYSPLGQKVIVRSKADEHHITVSVQDFGIGIDKEHVDRLFDRYYRVDNTAMRFEGLGLGLFISSEILKRHQGKFWIESEPGQGSTFFFSIPIVPEKPARPEGIALDLNREDVMASE
ncbi:PAS domain-containing protein [Mucilaginibacter phyllosphaerae]|uniref:histidine kinase n=1 Tax=Mucilaginibacter phyllosphaerae TaxID=1812349 RepID=A0A4Y8ABW3_9SPHI|nr:PAS domain-containing protein [Mucilaginibacter phyllosphaerae]MBB3969180.1 two-component system CheB/CheR fusion protein [Mucilaginibacter phyllosphaerae]TEW66013.1 PAS domain S-box protein [Mucilaginibacter phyllosphaerae]GGH06836.1 hypothetical protein GCM10007352_11230 [Mucilaginibacter phyllosphaerae]